MADRFDQFHVPQQSRRDKLRVVHNHHHQNCEDDHVTTTTTLDASSQGAFLPLYDPSFFPPDILTCSNTSLKQHNPTPPVYVKEEGPGPLPPNFMMSYVINNNNNMTTSTTSASSSSSSHHHQPPYNTNLLDPNPTAIHHHHPDNNPPFLYTVQNLRDFDQSFHQQQVLPSRTMPSVQALSLSLSSHHNHQQQQHQKQQTLPLELNLPSYGCGVRGGIIDSVGASTSSIDVRNSVPLGPFTGYTSILKGSRFLKPAKQLLDELCDVGRGVYFDTTSADSSSLMDFSMDSEIVDAPHVSSNDRASAHRQKKSRLISMLDEVYRRYKLYSQQMQAIVASFESVAGLGDAAPYTSFALKAMSKHFNCLKNAITDQLRSTNKILGEGSHSKDEAQRFEAADRWAHGQRVVQSLSYIEHQHQPVWRPQRGLPERAVSVLRAWLFEHFLHPYPTDTDKQMLAKQTGLSRSQVSNWFINARVRLWKPMVEEIHMLETRQGQKASDVEERNSSKSDDILPTPNADKQPQISCPLNIQNQTLKRSRTELHLPEKASEASSNLMYSNFSNQQHIGGGVSTSGGNSGVSLTLGLRQNNGIGLSESFPINIAHQFGLEASNQGYVIGSFATPNRHFGKDVGGQLFHDFVG